MSGWGCPHEAQGTCTRLKGRPCDPGMRGCILHGRFRFASEEKNPAPRRQPDAVKPPEPDAGT